MTYKYHQLANNHMSVMDTILQAFSDLAEALPRLDRLQALFLEDTHVNKVLGLIYSDLTEFLQQAYIIFRRKAWHVWFAFYWGLFERRLKRIIQRLSQHRDLLDKEAAAAHYAKMSEFREKCQLEEDAFEKETRSRMTRDVLQWLSTGEDSQDEYLQRISKKRVSKTCNWVLGDPQVQSWIEGDCGDAVLWMTGIPGAGKSFLCSLIIQNLQTQPHLSTLYYFCSHQSSSEDTCAKILCTLAIQLVQQDMDMVFPIHQAFFSEGSKRSSGAMRKLLCQILPTTRNTRIIIDGIDELEPGVPQETLKSLVEIQRSAKDNCKLLVCSREDPKIQKSLPARVHMKLVDKTSEGLGLYIKEQVRKLQDEFPGMDSALVHRVEQRLQSKAKGMFLWVRLVIATLIDQLSEIEIENAIDQLPEGLNEAYGLIMKRIGDGTPQHRKRIFTILYWVCVARRPIGLHEVADGIVLHPGQTLLSKGTRVRNLNQGIIDLCAPLLECSGNKVLDVVHFSAKEFFLDEQSGPFINIAEAHLSIALSCVINLTTCLEVVPHSGADVSKEALETRVVQGCYGLQSYGHEFWAEHVLAYMEVSKDSGPAARQLICALEVFSRVWKHHHTQTDRSCSSEQDPVEISTGLRQLRDSPKLYSFISSWLNFKAKLNEAKSNFNNPVDQQKWQSETDETHLSFINARLISITEGLLTLKLPDLPSHIEESDFKNFRSRFSFPCRFLGCHRHYDLIGDREKHEASHVPSFSCLQCDLFSVRGFRARKDLEKHTQRYHMSPEDFTVPTSLLAIRGKPCNDYGVNTGNSDVSSSRSRAWTEKGRKALQQGYRHVLANFESDMKTNDSQEQHSMKVTSEGTSDPRTGPESIEGFSLKKLDDIREKIQGQHYGTFSDFKNDLRELSRSTMTSLEWSGDENVDLKCEGELKRALSAFPAFVNFEATDSKLSTTGDAFETLSRPECETDGLAIPTLHVRKPHWSLAEKNELPELLRRCGRDFSTIADHLKIKTADEVDRYFAHLLDIGRTDLQNLANLADARLQQEACADESRIAMRLDLPTPVSNVIVQDSCGALSQPSHPAGIQPSAYPSDMRQYISHYPDSRDSAALQPQTHATAPTSMDGIAEEEVVKHQVKKKKRDPGPKVFCPHCTQYKDGLRNEDSLRRHILRHHTATRRVWICEDISIDKGFLAGCTSCSARKRYFSRPSTLDHLRWNHFNQHTPMGTLKRWMRSIEEPNPKMKAPLADSMSASKPITKRQATEDPPTSQHTVRRQKTEGTALLLPPIEEEPNISRTLPSIVASLLNLRASIPDINLDTLPDVSFDILLPGGGPEHSWFDEEGPPHRTNRALIRPYQVRKLPHLDPFRKTACLDQVEALHYELDHSSEHDSEYRETLERLSSLSRLLMRDLRNHCRRSTITPNIPFSV